MSKIKEATALLEEVTKDCGAAKQIADNQASYLTAKQKAEQAVSQIEKLPPDQTKSFAKEMDAIKKKIALAISTAEKDKKPADALPILVEAEKLLAKTKTKAEMQQGLNEPVPNVEYIKLLMKETGGTKALDEMVAAMGPNTNRNVLEAAIEARFTLEFKQQLSSKLAGKGTADKTAPDKSAKRIYELLLKVPESHAANNPKLNLIERQQEDATGADYGGGEVGLYAGRAGVKGSRNQGMQLGHPTYFPDGVDPDCQPNEASKKKNIGYFDWATLHEVGHAVDDAKRFMKNNQSNASFGEWEKYPDETIPATRAQAHFKYDLAYIKDKLQGNNPAPVTPPPAGTSATDWTKAQQAVDTWCAAVLTYGLWWDGVGTKAAMIGDRVYQHMGDSGESPPRLVSYNFKSRKQGIHGYQFRAPGEWFAELYAAYYMKVLKPENPSVKAVKATMADIFT